MILVTSNEIEFDIIITKILPFFNSVCLGRQSHNLYPPSIEKMIYVQYEANGRLGRLIVLSFIAYLLFSHYGADGSVMCGGMPVFAFLYGPLDPRYCPHTSGDPENA